MVATTAAIRNITTSEKVISGLELGQDGYEHVTMTESVISSILESALLLDNGMMYGMVYNGWTGQREGTRS